LFLCRSLGGNRSSDKHRAVPPFLFKFTMMNKKILFGLVLGIFTLPSIAQTFTFRNHPVTSNGVNENIITSIIIDTKQRSINLNDTDTEFSYTTSTFTLENHCIFHCIFENVELTLQITSFDCSFSFDDELRTFFVGVPVDFDKHKKEFNALKEYLCSSASSSQSSSSNLDSTFGSEPYTSTAVRDIRNKKDLTFDDLFYLCRAKTPVSALKRYYTVDKYNNVNLHKLSLSKTILGYPLSQLELHKWISEPGNNNKIWFMNASIYFGPESSSTAINEANHFLEEIQRYLTKRGRRVYIRDHGYLPGCKYLRFNEGHNTDLDISVQSSGLYKDRNGNSAWGVVIHISYPFH